MEGICTLGMTLEASNVFASCEWVVTRLMVTKFIPGKKKICECSPPYKPEMYVVQSSSSVPDLIKNQCH